MRQRVAQGEMLPPLGLAEGGDTLHVDTLLSRTAECSFNVTENDLQ